MNTRIGNVKTQYQAHIEYKDGTTETIQMIRPLNREIMEMFANAKRDALFIETIDKDWHYINLAEVKKILFSIL